MQQSDDIGELAAALAKAQNTIRNPSKTKDNPHFKSLYADLATGIESIRAGLSGAGIAVVQATEIRGDVVVLHTRLIHSSGQWIGSVYPVAPCALNHQQLGAAMTYARRQSLFALVEIAGAEDDQDGEDIGDMRTARGNGNGATITADQVNELRIRLTNAGRDEQKFLQHMKVGALSTMPASDFKRAISAIDSAVAAINARPVKRQGFA